MNAPHLLDHIWGFEKENVVKMLFDDIRGYCPALKFHQLNSAFAKIAPTYIAALGERRGCFRKLRYIGCTWCPEEPPIDGEFFKLGKTYVGIYFNGATYTIHGYGERPIGCAYFEYIEWTNEDSTLLDSLKPWSVTQECE
jgi:hypothetical protein